MPLFTDQMRRRIEVPVHPQRIVSLVPSQTELLYDLGLEKEVVGITKFCVHPPYWRKEKKIIGGTKNFHLDRIKVLQPDLIIGNKEENYQEGIEVLEKEFPVWMSDIYTLEDALRMISQVGSLTNCEEKGNELVNSIEDSFNQLRSITLPLNCLYLIWRNPYMAAGGNTFINDMLSRCGFRNMVSTKPRYPELSAAEIQQLNPKLIFLSSEPYPFKEKHMAEVKNLCPEAEVLLVDGEMFSWYGSRLCKAVPYLQDLLQLLSLRFKV